MSVVPWLGSPFKTGQQISDVVLGLAADVLKPTADAGTTVAPGQLLANGRLDVDALRREEPTLSKIAGDAGRLDAAAKAISEPAYLSVIGEARSQLQAQTSNVAHLLEKHRSGREVGTVNARRRRSALVLHGFPDQC